MKTLKNFITESIFNKQPKDIKDLRKIIEERLKKDKNANLNDIDVSHIKVMGRLFLGLDPHNINISEWNVANVENMSQMFKGCKNFNCDLSYWDVSRVKYMDEMFDGCDSLKKKPSWYKE